MIESLHGHELLAAADDKGKSAERIRTLSSAPILFMGMGGIAESFFAELSKCLGHGCNLNRDLFADWANRVFKSKFCLRIR